jgi:hypothetical protein
MRNTPLIYFLKTKKELGGWPPSLEEGHPDEIDRDGHKYLSLSAVARTGRTG